MMQEAEKTIVTKLFEWLAWFLGQSFVFLYTVATTVASQLKTMANNAGPLLFVIEDSELDPRQIAVCKYLHDLPTYKFRRLPVSMNELMSGQCKKGVAVWMNDYETLVLINFHKHDYHPQLAYDKGFEMRFHFDEKVTLKYEIWGDSADRILETALFFASLQVAENREVQGFTVCSRLWTFDDDHEGQLVRLLGSIPTKSFTVSCYSKVDNVFAKVLATRSDPIQLTLEHKVTMDVGVFLDHLVGRPTPFGSLFFGHCLIEEHDARRLLNHFHLFESLQMGRFAFTTVPGVYEGLTHLQVSWPWRSEFPTDLMLSFFDRVAHLGHLERLELDFRGLVAVEVVYKALFHALHSSKNMKELILYNVDHLQDLLAGLVDHDGLRILRVDRYPYILDPECTWIKQLLTQNCQLRAFCRYDNGHFQRAVDEVYALNRFYFGSVCLQQEPESIRAFLVGAALTHNAARVDCLGLLLAQHTDVLCGLLLAREMEADEEN